MQDEQSQPENKLKNTDPQRARPSPTSPNRQITKSPNRDMFGGPWLGVLVFLIVAVGLGWLLISLFQQQLESARQGEDAAAFEHSFDLENPYRIKRDMILGYMADGRIVLLPEREDLPRGTPGKRSAISVEELRESPGSYPDLIGVVDAGTQVQFVEIVDDRNNPQTRILLRVQVLTGPYARQTPALGMHLESTDTNEVAGNRRYAPRADLFEIVQGQVGPVQSEASDNDVN